MHNLGILLKNNFNIFLGNFRGKKNTKSYKTALTIFCVAVVSLLAIYSFQAYSMFEGLGKMGLGKLCVFHAIITTLSVILILGVMRSSANEKNNDNDFLLSLPLKKSEIILSKTLNKYFFDFFFVAMLFLPYIVLYQIFAGFNTQMFLLGLLLLFILPLLSVGISYIMDFLISRLFNRIKFGVYLKSLFLTFIMIIILGLMIIKTSTYGLVNISSMEEFFANRFFSNMVLKFLFETKLANTLFVLGLTIIPFVCGIVLYSLNFGKTFSVYTSNKKDLKFTYSKSSFGSFFKKELYFYLSTPAYIINTIIGPIMMVAAAILLSTLDVNSLLTLLGIANISHILPIGFSMLLCLVSATCVISACSISLEGKNLWILKSTPANEKVLFMAKALLHIAIVEPFHLISVLIASICFKFSILDILITLFVPLIFTLLLAISGVFINVLVPLLDWDNETKAVKQSLAVLLTMVMGALLAVLPLACFLILKTDLVVSFIVGVIGYALLLVLSTILCLTTGVKTFRKL